MQNLLLLLCILVILAIPSVFFWYVNTEAFEPAAAAAVPTARRLNSIVDIPPTPRTDASYLDELTLSEFKKKVGGLVNPGTYPNSSGWPSIYPDTPHVKAAFEKAIGSSYSIQEEAVIQCKRETGRSYYQVEWVLHRPGKRYGFHILVEAHESMGALKWSRIEVLGLVPEDLINSMGQDPVETPMPVSSFADAPTFSHDWEKGLYCKRMSDFKKQFGITPEPNPDYDCTEYGLPR